ncbi:hypothetical protein ACWDOR_24635 [Streptosporangium canum]
MIDFEQDHSGTAEGPGSEGVGNDLVADVNPLVKPKVRGAGVYLDPPLPG